MAVAASLASLPTETLFAICDFLTCSHPPSLLSLALTNKRLYTCACPFLYRSIKFEVRCAAQVAQDAQRCEALLRRDLAFSHVRRLFIHGDLGEGLLESKSNEATDDSSKSRDMPFKKLIRSPCDGVDKSSFQSFVKRSPYDGDDKSSLLTSLNHVLERGLDRIFLKRLPYRTDEFWKPLCRLIALLPGLTDLIWNTPDHLPQFLLETLHKHFTIRPDCARLRLHLCPLDLHATANAGLNPYEVALITSPFLYSVWVRFYQSHENGAQDVLSYTPTSVMKLVVRMAPNLKQLRFSYMPHYFPGGGNGGMADGSLLSTQQPWIGFQEAANNGVEGRGKSFGALEYLELDGNGIARGTSRPDLMQLRERSTDLSALRTLALYQPLSPETLESLCGLEITSLTLDYTDHDGSRVFESVQRLLRSLHRLRSLRILFETLPSSLDVSAALTRLYLPEVLGLDYYKKLLPSMIEKCQLIEDCAVTIPRFRGGAPEVRLYRLIGSWPRLRRLTLSLDTSCILEEQKCFEPRHVCLPREQRNSMEAGFDDDWDGQITAGPIRGSMVTKRSVRNMMIDMAVDGNLALAIFEAISRPKQARRDSLNSCSVAVVPLETLFIRVIGGGSWCFPSDFERSRLNHRMFQFWLNMQRSWRVTRDPRDDCPDVLHVVEVGRAYRMESEAEYLDQEVLPEYLSIFRRIWVERTRGSHWRDDWQSWPLESLENE